MHFHVVAPVSGGAQHTSVAHADWSAAAAPAGSTGIGFKRSAVGFARSALRVDVSIVMGGEPAFTLDPRLRAVLGASDGAYRYDEVAERVHRYVQR